MGVRIRYAVVLLCSLSAFAGVACAPPVAPTGPTPTPTARLASSSDGNCAITSGGELLCWGAGWLGLAGTDTQVQRLSATANPLLSGVTAVDTGNSGGCAVVTGEVWCWGSNSRGQVGDGTTAARAEAVQVPGIGGAVGVAVGDAHSCAVLDVGEVWCWGANDRGQLATGNLTDSPTPAQVGLTGATQIAAGANHTCALLADGAVRCWGAGGAWQLGNLLQADQTVPVAPVGLPRASAITAGRGWKEFSCALALDGVEWCWGSQAPPTADHRLPGPTGGGSIADIEGSSAITGGRDLVCVNSSGVWAQVPGGTDVTDVSPDGECLLHSDDTVECKGANAGGRLGNGTGSYVASPRPPVTGITTATDLAVGDRHSCVLLAGGEVSCWGSGLLGQRGDGTNSYSAVPTSTGITDGLAVGAGEFHSCAVRAGGSVWCWGSINGNSNAPVAIPGTADAVEVDGGQGFACARRSTGAVDCWGNNSFGMLGDGTTNDSTAAVPVSGLTDAVDLETGFNHACAVRTGGTVVCWGRNGVGALGDGTTNDSSIPVAVAGLTDVESLTAGFGHTCAVRTDGSVWCWGNADALDPGWSANPLLAAPVPGVTDVASATVAASHLCVTRNDSTVRCQGSRHFYGLMGDGTLGGWSPPVEPTGLGAVDTVESSPDVACALDGGEVRCWGYNRDNNLGDGGPGDQSDFGPVDGLD